MSHSKQHLYEENIKRSIREMYEWMEAQIMTIPEGTDEEDMSPAQTDIILNCMAIEAEWIMDPELRAEMSIIDWEEDD